ncbi:MAG: GNAT family N-acetyltransferase [Treponema sp.]|nr:GNAT family N-acetyltransferase [Treponema sp.]
MHIQLADSSLFGTVKAITQETIDAVYSAYYPRGAVDYFKAHHNDEGIAADIEAGAVYVLFDGDTAAGTMTVKENHIMRLFVRKEAQHRGFGKMLLDFAEEKIAECYDEAVLDASFPAKHIYLKRGYRDKDFCTVETGNGDYLCYDVMSKKLARTEPHAQEDRSLRLRPYIHDRDFDSIKDWIRDERTHALWCAGRTSFPLQKESFGMLLREISEKFGDRPVIAEAPNSTPVGFYCWSLNPDTNECMLKFVMTSPEVRGKGYGHKMLFLALHYAFSLTGADAVHLNVFSCNEPAKRCYQKTGFTERNVTENAFTFRDESWGRCNMIIRREHYQPA